MGADTKLARTRTIQLGRTSDTARPRHRADRGVCQGVRQIQVLLDIGRRSLGGWSLYAFPCLQSSDLSLNSLIEKHPVHFYRLISINMPTVIIVYV